MKREEKKLFVWPLIYWPPSLWIKELRSPLCFSLFFILPISYFLFIPEKTSLLSCASLWPVWLRRGAGRNKGMKTLSAVSTKVSVLSGSPVIQVTNVTVYGVIVNPYGFIDPTSVFLCVFSCFCWHSQAIHVLCRPRVVNVPHATLSAPTTTSTLPTANLFIFSLKTPSLTQPIYVTAILLLTAFALSRLVSVAANLTAALLFHPCFTLWGKKKKLFAVKISISQLIFTTFSLAGIPGLYKAEEFCLSM